MIAIIPASFTHAEELAENLRPGDAMEVEALGFQPLEALDAILNASLASQTALVDGKVAAMWGYSASSLLGPVADLWCLSGKPADGHPVTFMKASRTFVLGLQERYRVLRAMVALDYDSAVRWLRWLGFQDGPVETYGGRAFMRVMRHGV